MKISMTSMLMIMMFKSWTLIFFASFSRFSRIICKQQYGMWAICNLYQHREETDWVNMINVVAYFELSLSSLMFSSIPWGGRVSRLWRILRERFQEHCQTPSPGGAYFHYNSPGGVFNHIQAFAPVHIFSHLHLPVVFTQPRYKYSKTHTSMKNMQKQKIFKKKKVYFTWMWPICKLATWWDQGTALCSSEYWNSASWWRLQQWCCGIGRIVATHNNLVWWDSHRRGTELASAAPWDVREFYPWFENRDKTIVEICFMK